MYCPQCGQQQISDSTRFCSRCGLLVSGLAEWLARGGMVQAAREEAVKTRPSPKRKGMRRGAKLMFISGVLLLPFLGLAVVNDTPGPLIVPFTLFLSGLSILLYSVIFGDDTPIATRQPSQPSRLATVFRSNALPPAAHHPMQSVIEHPVRTAELVEPPSVTENTTKLLDRDERR